MPTIINLFMTYRCAIHPNQELVVVQPANGQCSVKTCSVCMAEVDYYKKEVEKLKLELVGEMKSITSISEVNRLKDKVNSLLKEVDHLQKTNENNFNRAEELADKLVSKGHELRGKAVALAKIKKKYEKPYPIQSILNPKKKYEKGGTTKS